MSHKPTVSIVIPNYNYAHFLKKALDSVISQTVTDWEAIVIDNFSTDNTIEVVESYKDSRIQVVQFYNNGIIAASRNQGIKRAKSDLIAFLDADDEWYPHKLEYCLQALKEDVDLVCHAELWVKNEEPFKEVIYGPVKRADYQSLLFYGNCLSTSAVIVRKSMLERVGLFLEDPSIVTAEDYDLWLKLAREKVKMVFLNEILGKYRLHTGNSSNAVRKNLDATLTVLTDHFSNFNYSGFGNKIKMRHRRALTYYGAARNFQHMENFWSAWRFLGKAFLIFPFFGKLYLAIVLNLFLISK